MNKILFPDLPVKEVLPRIRKTLETHTQLILEAPPGAGKTTLVPLALFQESWNLGKKILILEPRRLAARAAACRMAQLLGEQPGKTAGYRIRLESCSSMFTRIEVVTEGILTRMIQHDPSLEGVGALIFDEFHERSLQADLGLALALETQEVFRKDLRLLVMSATLDSQALEAIMPRAVRIASPGKMYPVTTRYLDISGLSLSRGVLKAVVQALREGEGGILVFLPGAGEIRQTADLLSAELTSHDLLILPLHSNLPWKQQQTAVTPAPGDRRKIVLATSIAETSLTIEDIRIVIDSGLMRVPRFDPGSGLDRLETITVTRDAADQRRGRAGRLGPGTCYRLWNQVVDGNLVSRRTPEILQVDLTSFALELALWGKKGTGELALIDHPPEKIFAASCRVLQELDALDKTGLITERGRQLAGLSLHPRLGHGLLEARSSGAGFTACLISALLSEGDFLKGENPDMVVRMEILERFRRGVNPGNNSPGYSAGVCRRVIAVAEMFGRSLGISPGPAAYDCIGEVLALAYPDRIGRRVGQGDSGVYQLVNGKQVRLDDEPFSRAYEYIVAASLGGGQFPKIFLAAPYSRELLDRQFAHHLEEEMVVSYDPDKKRVTARKRISLGRLLLQETTAPRPEPGYLAAALVDYIRSRGLAVLPWDDRSRALLARMRFVKTLEGQKGNWPGLSEEELLDSLDSWLVPWLQEGRLEFPLADALVGLISWEQRKWLDSLAPARITVPSGSQLTIDYTDPAAPVLAVRLQEMFGLADTPRVGGVPLTLHLLSPALRPVQITRDLAGFWKNSYHEVKKDLKGRYPKHYWPDDPLHAQPTRGTRKRGAV